jgi:hypothetical protein
MTLNIKVDNCKGNYHFSICEEHESEFLECLGRSLEDD